MLSEIGGLQTAALEIVDERVQRLHAIVLCHNLLGRDPGFDGERLEFQGHLLEYLTMVTHLVPALDGQRTQFRERAKHGGGPFRGVN